MRYRLLAGATLVLFTLTAQGAEWRDLWLNKSQQAQQAYQQGNYAEAAKQFAEQGSEQSLYNQATALAKAGELEAALNAYNTLLTQNPDHDDGTFNRDLVEKALRQQRESQNSPSNEGDSDTSPPSDSSQDDQQQGQSGQSSSDDANAESPPSNDASQQASEGESAQPQDAEPESSQQAGEKAQESADEPSTAEEETQQTSPDDATSGGEAMSESAQATEQWLRQIPDDPSGLLRRKLMRNHQIEYPSVRDAKEPW